MKGAALSAVLLAGIACAHLPPVDPEAEKAYYQTSTTVPGRDPDAVDYGRLRRARHFVDTAPGMPGRLERSIAELVSARSDRDRDRTVKAAEQMLALDYTDVEAHLEKARALHDRNRAAATFHEAFALGLLGSMLTGDAGRDQAHPIPIFSRREQTSVLAFLDCDRWQVEHTTAHGRKLEKIAPLLGSKGDPPAAPVWFDVTDLRSGAW